MHVTREHVQHVVMFVIKQLAVLVNAEAGDDTSKQRNGRNDAEGGVDASCKTCVQSNTVRQVATGHRRLDRAYCAEPKRATHLTRRIEDASRYAGLVRRDGAQGGRCARRTHQGYAYSGERENNHHGGQARRRVYA